MNNEGNFISVAEAAVLLGVSKRTITRRIRANAYETAYKLPGATGSYLLNRTEIERLALFK